MRILLLTAPIPVQNATFPLGLAYVSAMLKSKGYEVKTIDSIAAFKKYSREDIKNLIKAYKPDVVGFSLFINFISDVYDFLAELKKEFPGIVFIAGGPHATALPEELVRHGFDFVVIGEGEETALELIECLQRNISSFERVKGIAYLDKKNSNIVVTEPRPLIKDLDLLPFPEREPFPIENYTGSKNWDSDPYFWILLSSRGCPFDCLYCMNADVFGRGYRFRSAESILKEIKHLYDKFGVKYVYFIDDEFMIRKDRIYKLTDIITENNLDIGWTALARITTIDTEFLNRMVKAGLKEVVYGVESGDPVTLEKINKKMSLNDIKRGIEQTLKSNIPAFGVNNMIGFPWETKENMMNTYELNKSIGYSIPVIHTFWVPIPYPRTGLYEQYHKKYGFTGWWLNKKSFIEEYDKDNYQPFFKRHMFFLDHPQLKLNFYKYNFFHRVFIKRLFIKVWFLQANRRFSRAKRYSIFFLSFFSYFLYLLSARLEKQVVKLAYKPNFYAAFRKIFHIEKQVSIEDLKPR